METKALCAFVTVYHACKTTIYLLRLQRRNADAFALERSIDQADVREVLDHIEHQEPGFIHAAEERAVATANRMHGIIDEIRTINKTIDENHAQMQRAAGLLLDNSSMRDKPTGTMRMACNLCGEADENVAMDEKYGYAHARCRKAYACTRSF